MKFIHIADIHLGATPDSDMPWGPDRRNEIWDSFRGIIRACNENRTELLLIAGDLFHRQPLLKELKEVDYCFSKLETAMVVLMAGNHDYIGAKSYYRDFKWNERVHMFSKEDMSSIFIPEINTEVYGFNYCTRDITEPGYDRVRPVYKDRINILLAHGGDERNVPINRRRLADAGFDYIALGHIHKPELINSRMAYAGSLEPLDKNETGEHGFILGEVKRVEGIDNQTQLQFVPSSTRQYKRVILSVNPDTTNGSLKDQAIDAIGTNGKQHIYTFLIQGFRSEDLRYDTNSLLTLGNVLEIKDESVPDYDFEALYQENADNIIGQYINRIKESQTKDKVADKALYYGIEALLGARD